MGAVYRLSAMCAVEDHKKVCGYSINLEVGTSV